MHKDLCCGRVRPRCMTPVPPYSCRHPNSRDPIRSQDQLVRTLLDVTLHHVTARGHPGGRFHRMACTPQHMHASGNDGVVRTLMVSHHCPSYSASIVCLELACRLILPGSKFLGSRVYLDGGPRLKLGPSFLDAEGEKRRRNAGIWHVVRAADAAC